MWFARSNAFVGSTGFQTFTWLRIIGGATFTLGGVAPLVWLVVRSRKRFKKNDFKIEPNIKLKQAEELETQM